MLEILFHSSYVTIRTFNVLLALGFIFTGIFVVRYCMRQKMELDFLLHSLPYLVLSGLVVGRSLFVLENLAFFENQWLTTLYFWDLRFSFFGVLYGGMFALFLFAKLKKEAFWSWLDVSIFSMLIMMFFIHIGQFFNGQNYGALTDLPWGITFTSQNIPYLLPIHPTQLYSALATLLIFMYSLKKDKRIHLPGVTGARALMLYCLAMAGVDFFHGAPSLYAKISLLALSAISFILLIHCSHRSHMS